MDDREQRVIVVGAGPAGLAAALEASRRHAAVTVFERGRIAGRKFLVAGKGGLNLTHAEPLEEFLARYRESAPRLAPFVRAFPPEALRALAAELGQPTWVGSSGRVFPRDAKAAPLLRAWISTLKRSGVVFRHGRRFTGFAEPSRAGRVALAFERDRDGTPELVEGAAAVLALGGASWPKTGSDASWVPVLRAAGVDIADLVASNAGVECDVPPSLDGASIKNVGLECGGERAEGDVAVTRYGLEGTPVYRLNAAVRAALARGEAVTIRLDFRPALSVDALAAKLDAGGSKSLSSKLKALKIPAPALALLRTRPRPAGGGREIALNLKSFPLEVRALRPVDEAISSAGGVRWSALDGELMLRTRPGVFVAGEMIDWDAPTGGYLLQACVSTGIAAGRAAAARAANQGSPASH